MIPRANWRTFLRSVKVSKQSFEGCSPRGKLVDCFTSVRRTFSSNSHDVNERGQVLRPFIFTLGMTGASFSICSIIQYERQRQSSPVRNYWQELNKKRRVTKEFPFREKAKQWWDTLGEGHKMAAGVIGMNLVVLAMWRTPALQPFMQRWFQHSPANPRTLPLLLSCFSHMEFWHFGCNMFVLWSFAPHIRRIMGSSEQTAAFYISAGCISSFTSHLFKIATRSAIPSVGASGALLAVLGACCIKDPDSQLRIIFLPFLVFSAGTALKGLLLMDSLGVLMRWQLFDHAAHLGGTLFGCWYAMFGRQYIWDQRAPIIRKWHEFRKWLEDQK